MAETVAKANKASSKNEAAPKAAGKSKGLRKAQEGVVVSSKMNKTIVVAVVRQIRHAAYGKFVRRTKKFYAHDESNQCGVGDRVRIVETRPLSRLKRWRLESVIRKAD